MSVSAKKQECEALLTRKKVCGVQAQWRATSLLKRQFTVVQIGTLHHAARQQIEMCKYGSYCTIVQ